MRNDLFLSAVVCLTSLGATISIAGTTASAQSTDVVYYWVTPNSAPYADLKESFVIEVNRGAADQVEAIKRDGGTPGLSGSIAAGSVSYNKNYYAPGQPVWNWHFTVVNEIFDFRNTVFAACMCPDLIAKPSDIAGDPNDWIRQNGSRYTPEYFKIDAQVDPKRRSEMANVSNRGAAGSGEKTLISGFIISGGEPRNILVRALGPSLATEGIQQPATNPQVELRDASGEVANNTDWKLDIRTNELSAAYPALAPGNEKEAAMLLTLAPGAYTVQGSSEDGSEGVMLIEAYDLDAPQ